MIGQKTKMIFTGLTCSLLLVAIPAKGCLAASKSAFTTKDGYALTQEQYDKISQVYNDDVLYLQDKETIGYWLQDDVEIIPGETIYIQVDELYDANGTYLGDYEQEISEPEAAELEEKIQENDEQPLIRRDFSALASLAAKVSPAKSRETELGHVETKMKRLSISTSNQFAVSSKRIVLLLKWKKNCLPKMRSFDVIAIRPGMESTFYSTKTDPNLSCTQFYDGKKITYNPFGDHCVKKLGAGFAGGNKMDGHYHGCGFSLNLVNSAKNSLSCVMEMTVTTSKKNFVAYGSYQHATQNVSLAESKKYSISYEGLGKVILFDNKVKGKYDGMNGVAGVYKQ